MSVFAAVTATFVKEPAEKALWSHVKYLRELLDNHVLAHIVWLGTRDMTSDGLTKGAIDRTLLHAAMSGSMSIGHECRSWHAKVNKSRHVHFNR